MHFVMYFATNVYAIAFLYKRMFFRNCPDFHNYQFSAGRPERTKKHRKKNFFLKFRFYVIA